MLEVFQNFKDNIEEVEHYFVFLEKVETGYTLLSDGGGDNYSINNDLSRMLKANAFLIIYNLIEATVKSGLWEIFGTIRGSNLQYHQLIKELQLLWIDHKIKLEFKTQDATVNQKIQQTIGLALAEAVSYYESKAQMKFDAGSLDVRNINATFKRHGLAAIPAHELISDSFRTTKNNRNFLAHGDMTFKQCGKDYSFRDLRIIKCHVIRYLFRSLFSMQAFIENQKI